MILNGKRALDILGRGIVVGVVACRGRRFETKSRLLDGDVKGRFPDVNNHI